MNLIPILIAMALIIVMLITLAIYLKVSKNRLDEEYSKVLKGLAYFSPKLADLNAFGTDYVWYNDIDGPWYMPGDIIPDRVLRKYERALEKDRRNSRDSSTKQTVKFLNNN